MSIIGELPPYGASAITEYTDDFYAALSNADKGEDEQLAQKMRDRVLAGEVLLIVGKRPEQDNRSNALRKLTQAVLSRIRR